MSTQSCSAILLPVFHILNTICYSNGGNLMFIQSDMFNEELPLLMTWFVFAFDMFAKPSNKSQAKTGLKLQLEGSAAMQPLIKWSVC